MNVPAAVLLGVLQGITEFLPVSSSAHLILARTFFGWEMPPELGLAFDVALHVGTLAAILIFFRREVTGMLAAIPGSLDRIPNERVRLVRLIAVGTLPIIFVGLLFSDYIERVLRTPGVAAGALMVGAAAMLVAERLGPRTRTEQVLTWIDAVLIGCAQASALIPGVSRSGSTIAIGMFLGMRRDAAARFTFLLAIPATAAAAGREALELRHLDVSDATIQLLVIGALVSAVVGYLTIKYFLRFLAGHKLDIFAYYRLALAGVTITWLLAK